ncbi:alpha/beta hydrolase [Croceicoccus sp. BE223]|uniref:alpha/beta hydrolase n=1 Tax=Croceicoccus sp. BE223 TaxID=2817716 RepID=UPI00286AC08A|nr:alpha/beta hydrolase [Croceicoccus sp. BE223]
MRPRLALFRPRGANTGAAVVIAPGGGYRHVVVDREGFEMASWLADRGIAAFVLFYRLPGDGWADGADVALVDAQRAIRFVRERNAEFALDPDRVAMIGFSAGGHLCADLAARFAQPLYVPVDAADQLSARPFCAAPIYPVVKMSGPDAHAGSRLRLLGPEPTIEDERRHAPHLNVTGDTPPHFIVHAEDDSAVPIGNALSLRAALVQAGVPVDTHLFASGGHGFGLGRAAGLPVAIWPEIWLAWARGIGLA